MQRRSCGILLHISSLPSAYGIGDLGPAAHDFAATLAASGISCWQFLPLTPISEFIGNSPYSSPSAFAGNPLFISPEFLCESGYISPADVENAHCLYCGGLKPCMVDYPSVYKQRSAILNAAFERGFPSLCHDKNFEEFCAAHAYWLDGYAMFLSIKEQHGGKSWVDWPDELKWRKPQALGRWAEQYRRNILKHKFVQYLFFSQWQRLHTFCKKLGISLVGDMPIYVTHDSADVWSAPELFRLDDKGLPVTVAGVPPDYFSATGQRWGNPVYRWDVMRKDGFAWWIKRLEHNLLIADIVRLDHFRGFCGYWEIPAEEETAVKGQWVPAPGREFFSAVQAHFGRELPIIAEDLGVITDDVRALMAEFSLPGMKVLQFGFGGHTPARNPDAPFRHPRNSVVYTGTHDNTTTLHWYCCAQHEEKKNLCNYVGRNLGPDEALDAMLRLALGSQANLAVIPMQDVLGLGETGRMNTPSVAKGNWEWRLADQSGWVSAASPCAAPVPSVFSCFYDLCRIYGRLAEDND